MVVINAEINQFSFFSRSIAANLKELCETLDIPEPVSVNTVEALAEKLEEHRDHDILLFSNFPPDSSYPDGKKTGNSFRNDECGYQSWQEDTYARSISLFKYLGMEYKFKAIHFITGAPEKLVSDEMLRSFSGHFPVTVARKKDWLHRVLSYEQLFILFMLDKIKEAIPQSRRKK